MTESRHPLRLRASRLDGGAPTRYPSSPLTNEMTSKKDIEPTQNKQKRSTKREIAPAPSILAHAPPLRSPPARPPPLAWAGTSRRPWLPGSPSPPGRISPWKTAQISAHAGICPLSILWPFLPPSRALSAVLSIGCSGGGDAPASVAFHLCTTSTCRPLCVRTALGTFQSVHARSSIYRTLLRVISRLTLGRVSCSWPCPSAYSHSALSTCWLPSPPSPPSSLQRSV